jgi:aminopeptidase N
VTSPYASLQHAEALARRDLLQINSYDVDLDLSGSGATFASTTVIRVFSRGGSTFLDLKPQHLREVSLDGVRLDVDLLTRGRFPLDLSAGHHEIAVRADMPYRRDGEGLHRYTDPADGRVYLYGMNFMDAAPTVYACFDQPDLKAPYTLHVTAPADWVVVANAAAVEPATDGDVARWDFAATPPLSTYFVTLVAGPYHLIRDEHDGIPLGLSARASLAADLDRDAEDILAVTRASFDELHRLFAIRYPFGDYHQAFVPEFNAGAMENPGCVTFRDGLVFSSRVTRPRRINRATTIAHEMAHQWFGNIVTPAWWDDLWLNESFAEYLGNRVTAEVTEYDDTWTDMVYARRQWGLVADQRPTTHPVASNGAVDAAAALQNFDGISYAKGSAILRQLNAAIGDEVFFGGVREHLTQHRFGNATMADLIGSWEGAGAGDLSGFVTHWLQTAGPDTLTFDRDRGLLRRTPPAAHPAQRQHAVRVAVGTAAGWALRQVRVEGPETATEPIDPSGAVILDAYADSWVAAVPDATTMTSLTSLLPMVHDDLLRAGIWDNIRSGFHAGALDPADVVEVAVASLPIHDAEDTARRTMPWLMGTVVPLAPADAAGRIHSAAADQLRSSEPGSEVQLAAFRSVISTCPSVPDLERWAAGTDLPDGVDLDVDLRWRALVRLAILGATDQGRLEAELAVDPNATANVEFCRARASLPTAEAKQWAWDCFTGGVEVANYELNAAGSGMWRYGQEHLTAPYVARYFADLPGTVEVRSGWLLAESASAFFPDLAVTDETVSMAHALLERDDLDLSLRRRLLDETDELVRRLAVRRRFPHVRLSQ